jgi:hypothetical protein
MESGAFDSRGPLAPDDLDDDDDDDERQMPMTEMTTQIV